MGGSTRILGLTSFLAAAGCGPGEHTDVLDGVWERRADIVGRDVITTDGAVRGHNDEGVLEFLGIPYAAPPLGDLRWRAPEAPTQWDGTRDATAAGPACTQSWDPSVGSEDCLYLNVFTPEGTRRDAALPTMVHIHGGGNAAGWAHEDASALVANGVVVVTFNYRLNVLGFLGHPALTAEAGHSANYGVQDQIAVLKWVQDNIAAFGGDPDRVTLFGFSAGSFDTTALAASPLTEGLVHRAAIQGAIPWSDRLAVVEEMGVGIANDVGCGEASDVAACLRDVPAAALIAVMPDWFYDLAPVRDGYVLPDYPRVLFQTKRLDLIIGNDREEASVWYYFDDWLPKDLTEDQYIALMGSEEWGYGPFTDQMLALYPVSEYDSPWWATIVVDTDWVYTCASRRVALNVSAGEPDVWRYLFTHTYDHATTDGFPAPELRAHHGIDENFLWNEWDEVDPHDPNIPGPNWYRPTSAERKLSREMATYWTNFARTGDPNGPGLAAWPRYEAAHERIQFLDTPVTSSAGYHVPHCDVQEATLAYFNEVYGD